ncbi:PREDICTED: uncharacterized protein LOC109163279 [Ipomoea nil]|uniref:uncharacterized protein LOC109163279 n=1 Tax=Ipomoea nil TaxID=35883 RepID=UPI000900C12B|nr:PREDICTED: uncharacterized protein LOC109163279 [Ipomoea nil]
MLSDSNKKQFALVELEKLLSLWGKNLRDFPEMPIADESNMCLSENMLIDEELAYDKESLKTEHETLRNMQDARVENDIVASSGITPLNPKPQFALTESISQDSDLAELIIRSKLIIWDEVPMMHKHCFVALDKIMRDLLRFVIAGSAGKRFGGKTVVFGGDFRQILLVIPKATRPVVVGTIINSSCMWTNCNVLTLTKNLRLRSLVSEEDIRTVDWFSKWIADIRDEIVGVVMTIHLRSIFWHGFY